MDIFDARLIVHFGLHQLQCHSARKIPKSPTEIFQVVYKDLIVSQQGCNNPSAVAIPIIHTGHIQVLYKHAFTAYVHEIDKGKQPSQPCSKTALNPSDKRGQQPMLAQNTSILVYKYTQNRATQGHAPVELWQARRQKSGKPAKQGKERATSEILVHCECVRLPFAAGWLCTAHHSSPLVLPHPPLKEVGLPLLAQACPQLSLLPFN